ncbi:MAG: dihydrolipoamide succinyltransferase [Candidatus Muproteobacteria bacterium RBG_16_60_9]|uniref:Dihydrolipoyllysine-residue succinyltransferase component of 2-oxoglutarate dehydrogenase complex n=1 Tax=Candidatus Muproteobacteria bacterium RBG_16_60_9 TaxID=1817755 RepID=A0A1F6UW28_9PROT|nr:MAG: dihydrolipoamide succinyltransferase [Candidatus Muproteobacteria bacterium RBG_16_60_9]
MASEVAVPTFPESVTDGTLVSWRKQPGEAVKRGDILADVETDKVVFEVPAADDGVLAEIIVAEGTTVTSGQVIGRLGAGSAMAQTPQPKADAKPASAAPAPAQTAPVRSAEPVIMPAARRAMAERGIAASAMSGSGKGGRVLKEDVLKEAATPRTAEKPMRAAEPVAVAAPGPSSAVVELPTVGAAGRPEKRVPMTRLRARIAERLVEAQHTAAILTTFNEVNMQPVMDLRSRYREAFEREHKIKLGFMSFFVKASVEALKRFPEVNASIEGTDIIYHGYHDVGIAVSSPRGLVVPIVRDADRLDMASIETRIKEFGDKAQGGTLALADITGGTFTITNGGIFGSLVSTPILNPPQSAILGMHKIQDRPVAENGAVVIRPMMYLALSYDHRIVDGREAVRFLVTIKEMIEDPARLLLGV